MVHAGHTDRTCTKIAFDDVKEKCMECSNTLVLDLKADGRVLSMIE